MEENRTSGTKTLAVIIAAVGVAAIVLGYNIYSSKDTVSKEAKTLNKLIREKSLACNKSFDKERCEKAVEALEEFSRSYKGSP